VSVFAGVVLSLGSSGGVSQAMSGLVLQEEITIPNAVVVGATVKSYSRLAAERTPGCGATRRPRLTIRTSEIGLRSG
jgi:hypothetical protein